MKRKGFVGGAVKTVTNETKRDLFLIDKMFRDYLGELNVAFYDSCCPNNNEGFPLRFTEGLERLNSDGQWVPVSLDGDNPTFSSIEVGTIGNDGSDVEVTDKLVTDSGISNMTGLSHLVPFISISAQTDIAAGTGGAIGLTSYVTTINTDAGGDAFTLADGTIVGQLKKILLVVDGGGNAVITPVSLSGGTTITLDDAGDYVTLIWDGTDWYVVENIGGTVA